MKFVGTLQESERSVSLCTNIGNMTMSIPFQIICDSYTQVFYAFNIFQYSALKGVVSLYLTRPFIRQLHLISDSLSAEMSFIYKENSKGPRTVP